MVELGGGTGLVSIKKGGDIKEACGLTHGNAIFTATDGFYSLVGW